MMRLLRAMGAAIGLAACAPPPAPEGQVLLYVDTDAWLPLKPGASVEGAVFDSLRIEVYEPGKTTPCDGCTRTFSIDYPKLKNLELSFGLRLRPNEGGYRVRLRMFPSFATLTGDPPEYPDAPATAVVEVVARLPAIADTGIVSRNVFLATDDVGLPRGTLDEPVETSEGAVTASRVQTWSGAAAVPCAKSPGSGEVCIEGGAFWMGNARVVDTGLGDGADRLRLVVLSPFFVDAGEVTVGAFRAAGFSNAREWSGGTTGTNPDDFCTFVPSSAHDAVPLNCVDYATVRSFCQKNGGDLPTEAQFEFVSGARKNRLYVWGEAEPGCDDAVINRGGWGIFDQLPQECKPTDPPGSPLALGQRPPGIDWFDSGKGKVYDLVGNLTEFMADRWNRQTEPCWTQGGVYVDPVCTTASTLDPKLKPSIKGASFVDPARLGAASARSGKDALDSIRVGFRCARSATP